MKNGKTAAEIYEVQPNYKRFNQKFNMTIQRHWNEEARRWNEEMKTNLGKLLNKQANGYRLEDWAFAMGANGNLVNTGFRVNESFAPGNYWLPLSSRPDTKRAFPDISYSSAEARKASPEENNRLVARFARAFGADDVGFAHLDRRWVFSHYWDAAAGKDYPIRFSDEAGLEEIREPARLQDGSLVIPAHMHYCIVLVHEMDREGIAAAPTLTQLATTQLSYSRISYTAVMLAEFIRGLGYNAIPSANDLALSIPLAVDAGLGELARNLKLVHPKYGPCCRISKVITDLPFNVASPGMLGVAEFCQTCRKCADACPGGAISPGDPVLQGLNECNNNGVLQWQIDHRKCSRYWAKVGTNCGICIRVCPFNKPDSAIHRAVRWGIKNMPFLNRVFLWFDNVLGYGGYKDPSRFWRLR